MLNGTRNAALGAATALLVSGCCFGPDAEFIPLCNLLLEAPNAVPRGAATGPLASDCAFSLVDDTPGGTSAQLASCMIPAGSPQLLSATFAYPPGFAVSPEGFLAAGEAPAGRYEVELAMPGAPSASFPILPSGVFSAWADLDGDGAQDFWEPEIFRSEGLDGGPLLRIDTPSGGDDTTMVNTANVGFVATVELAEGILFNPATPGDYAVTVNFQGVDPDTGGPNNGGGVPPVERVETLPFEVGKLLVDGFEGCE